MAWRPLGSSLIGHGCSAPLHGVSPASCPSSALSGGRGARSGANGAAEVGGLNAARQPSTVGDWLGGNATPPQPLHRLGDGLIHVFPWGSHESGLSPHRTNRSLMLCKYARTRRSSLPISGSCSRCRDHSRTLFQPVFQGLQANAATPQHTRYC